jgi:ATP-dependent exoDNAse (exonuclease V) alpha subunit
MSINNVTKSNNSLTLHQQEVFENIVSNIDARLSNILKTTNINDYLFSLMGSAGTGKTYLTTQIVKYLKEHHNEYTVKVTAPTHKAVGVLAGIFEENDIEVSCKTIHSFLGIKPFQDYKTGIEKFIIDKTKKEKETASLLIVDESSMISHELYQYILETLEEERVEAVLFIGDPYQLLPVDGSETNIFDLPNKYELNEIVRQAKDSYIINLATRVRERIKNQDFIELKKFIEENKEEKAAYFHNKNDFLNDFYKNEKWYKEDKVIATHMNKDVTAFNKTVRNRFWEEKGNSTPPTLLPNDMLRFTELYSVNEVTIYHNGQVIKLDDAILKYHETLGIEYWECKAVNTNKQQVFRVIDPTSEKFFNDKLTQLATLAKNTSWPERKNIWRVFYQTRDMFAKVQYIFSSTIHKLQGSTYDTSYIDIFGLAHNGNMSDDEKYRLLYVAITRARKDIKFFISSFDMTNQLSKHRNNEIDIKQSHQYIDENLKNLFK